MLRSSAAPKQSLRPNVRVGERSWGTCRLHDANIKWSFFKNEFLISCDVTRVAPSHPLQISPRPAPCTLGKSSSRSMFSGHLRPTGGDVLRSAPWCMSPPRRHDRESPPPCDWLVVTRLRITRAAAFTGTTAAA